MEQKQKVKMSSLKAFVDEHEVSHPFSFEQLVDHPQADGLTWMGVLDQVEHTIAGTYDDVKAGFTGNVAVQSLFELDRDGEDPYGDTGLASMCKPFSDAVVPPRGLRAAYLFQVAVNDKMLAVERMQVDMVKGGTRFWVDPADEKMVQDMVLKFEAHKLKVNWDYIGACLPGGGRRGLALEKKVKASKAFAGSTKAAAAGNNNEGNDEIYTPELLAQAIVQKLKTLLKGWDIKDPTWLDPSMGAGAFYKNYGDVKKMWCEIEQGRDFFDFAAEAAAARGERAFDFVVCTNPPVSFLLCVHYFITSF